MLLFLLLHAVIAVSVASKGATFSNFKFTLSGLIYQAVSFRDWELIFSFSNWPLSRKCKWNLNKR